MRELGAGRSIVTDSTWSINITKTAVVSTDTFWMPIDKDTPRNCKVLAISRRRCGVAQFAEIRTDEKWYDYWHPLPKFKEGK